MKDPLHNHRYDPAPARSFGSRLVVGLQGAYSGKSSWKKDFVGYEKNPWYGKRAAVLTLPTKCGLWPNEKSSPHPRLPTLRHWLPAP